MTQKTGRGRTRARAGRTLCAAAVTPTDAEQVGHLAREQVAVEALAHRRPRGGRQTSGELVVAFEPEQRRGDRLGVVGRHEQAVAPVLDQLRDSGDRRADARHAAGHRLDEHVRDPVAVTAVDDPAREADGIRPPVGLEQLGLRLRAREHDAPGEAALGDPAPDLAAVVAVLADDRRLERDAAPLEQRARFDEDVEALLLDQPPDPEQPQAPVARTLGRRSARASARSRRSGRGRRGAPAPPARCARGGAGSPRCR